MRNIIREKGVRKIVIREKGVRKIVTVLDLGERACEKDIIDLTVLDLVTVLGMRRGLEPRAAKMDAKSPTGDTEIFKGFCVSNPGNEICMKMVLIDDNGEEHTHKEKVGEN